MDITMDQIDEFTLKDALWKLEVIMCDIMLIANEREQHGIRAMANDAVNAVKTVKYALRISGAKS